MKPFRVASAFPDPPFELDGTGFDIDLGRALAGQLGLEFVSVPYSGGDFNGIFQLLTEGACEAVISGATVTPEREKVALFCEPYVRSGQSLVVRRDGKVRSVEDLEGRTLGIQRGNTSDIVARQLLAQGRLGRIQYYDYASIQSALTDLEQGRLDGLMKLAPVMHWLTRDRPALEVVQQGITVELIAVAVRLEDTELKARIEAAQRAIDLPALGERWLAGMGAEVICRSA